jgi:hypothetical protein
MRTALRKVVNRLTLERRLTTRWLTPVLMAEVEILDQTPFGHKPPLRVAKNLSVLVFRSAEQSQRREQEWKVFDQAPDSPALLLMSAGARRALPRKAIFRVEEPPCRSVDQIWLDKGRPCDQRTSSQPRRSIARVRRV